MLVSGGQILAIDKVNTGNTNTILGDGVQKPLDVNTDLIATTSSVSSVSSVLEQQIDSVSSNFKNYYTKEETSGAQQIQDAFDNFKTTQTIVSAGSDIVDVASAKLDEKTVVYTIKVTPGEINIAGASGVSAKYDDGTWTIGLSADFLSANALEDYYKKSETSAAEEISKEFANTSSWANETFLKEHQSLDDYYKKSETSAAEEISAAITALSSWADETFLKEHQSLEDYYKKSETSGAEEISNALSLKQDVSAMSAYATSAWVDENYQKKGDYITSANDSLAGEQLVLKDNKWQVLEEIDWTDKISAASAAAVTSAKNYTDTKLDDYYKKNETSSREELEEEFAKYQLKGDYLSANALDDISGKWESVYNTVYTASGSWNEASAFAANSAKFVTSAGVEFDPALAYFLKKSEESVAWSGVDLSNLGKMYQISSLTPDLISAGISADEQNNPFYVLSAAAPEQVATPDISGYGLSAWKDTEDNKYFVSANIVGNHGVSASYDAEANAWNVGISANEYAYYSNTYENNAGESVDSNTIIKFVDGISHNIIVDSDGYITLPDTGNKFTVCINETVTDNTDSNTHSYLLNKIQLCSKHENDADAVLVSTNNYYATEVGSSDATIAYTLTNTPNTKYFVKYAGSKIDVSKDPNAKLHVVISILEEISSLATTEGGGAFYTGIEPIYVEDASNKIGLAYDREQFQIVPGTDTDHPELSALQINIHTTGGDIDQEAFEKLAGMINSRMTETYPIASVKYEHTIDASCQLSYLFRPTIEYDCTSATSAFIYAGNADSNTLVSVAIYDAMNLVDDKVPLVWCSEATNVQGSPGGQRILPANMAYTANFGTIHPEGLYYASIRVTNHVLNNAIGDIDGVTVTGDIDIGNPKPWVGLLNISNHDWPTSTNNLGSMANAHFKAYIGFKNN